MNGQRCETGFPNPIPRDWIAIYRKILVFFDDHHKYYVPSDGF